MKSFINQYYCCNEVLPENSVYEDKCKIGNVPSTGPKSILAHRCYVYVWMLGIRSGCVPVSDVAETVVGRNGGTVFSETKLD